MRSEFLSVPWILSSVAAVSLFAHPSVAAAQTVATSFADLRTVVKPGDTVEVTGVDGRKTTRRIAALTDTSLTLAVRELDRDGRERYVPKITLFEQDVRRIRLEHRDTVWNGALIGWAVGAVPLLLVVPLSGGGGGCGSDFNVCPGFALLLTGPIGMGIGAWVDASHKRRTMVYDRGRSEVRVFPVLSRSAVGMQVAFGF